MDHNYGKMACRRVGIFIILTFVLFSCSKNEPEPDPLSILQSKTWVSYKFGFESKEYEEFILSNRFLDYIPNTFIGPGDSMKTYISYRLTFYDNSLMDFSRTENKYLKCATCDEYKLYDTLTQTTKKHYYVKKRFVVLSNINGYSPYYYETDITNDHKVAFLRCVTLNNSSDSWDQAFDGVTLKREEDYFVDVYMQTEESLQ